ncbi:unnamed protein product [Cuscuta campestris]|uniref:C3H1-type domain-containing protein n=1 Tax=Cuscuta campestris TaxID=132261 RepID=A0A484MFL1_9ASTE|nr:unnamed protein product [Cuscuta campestris]
MDAFHRSNPQVTQMPTATAAAAAAPVASAEEEAIKKNTDCVYFLASPLTCKKGSECEYRHSDSARLNPRDCWYWLNGNCLNPKCAFRHPPLDALVGPEALNHAETFMPPAHAMAAAAQMPYVSNKHGVPCIFFQQGICMKGDRCSFFHAQTSLANKAPQKQGALPPTTEAAPKKTFGALEKCTQLKNNPQINALKSGGIPTAAKPVVKEGLPLAKNHFLADKNTTPLSVNDDERSKYKATSVPANGNPVSRTSQMQPGFDDHDDNLHNKDEEVSREASPGFDVLVDDELRDSDYYPVEDQYGGAGDHERSEYDANPSADYSMGGIDQDVYREAHNDYEKRYGWEQRGVSSERKQVRSYPDRRHHGNNTNSLDHVRESDLRHRLSKPRKVNGLRSVISNEHTHHEKRVEGRGNYRGSWRERNNLSSSHESSSISSRLQGRISVPVRSSPLDVAEIRPEVDRSRDRDRLSHGRLQERMRGRLQEDPGFVVGRHSRGPLLRRDVFGEDDANFAAPKSLSELKGKKSGVERNGELSHLGKRKSQQNFDDLQSSGGGDLSFEGPKPLEEILKRKRRASDNNSGDHNNHQRENTTATIQPSSFLKEDVQPPSLSSSINHSGKLENNKSVEDDLEVEDGMVADEEGAEYEDDVAEGYEGDPQGGEEEDYYEQVNGDEEDVNLNDHGENVDPEDEEYLYEDEDADDFAKKMAVVFS